MLLIAKKVENTGLSIFLKTLFALAGVENSISQKRKRLVRVRPKFQELTASAASAASAATATSPTLVKVSTSSPNSQPTAAPPLIAATNTLLVIIT